MIKPLLISLMLLVGAPSVAVAASFDCFNLGPFPSFEEIGLCSAWYYDITFGQALAFFVLFTLLWSFKVAISHVREPSKDTLQRIFYIQLLGSTCNGFFEGLSDPKDFVLILTPLVWVPLVLIAAWVAVKVFKLANSAYKYVHSRYDNMPAYQISQDGAKRPLDPLIVRFVDDSGNTRYRVEEKVFLTLYSAESYLDQLKSYKR